MDRVNRQFADRMSSGSTEHGGACASAAKAMLQSVWLPVRTPLPGRGSVVRVALTPVSFGSVEYGLQGAPLDPLGRVERVSAARQVSLWRGGPEADLEEAWARLAGSNGYVAKFAGLFGDFHSWSVGRPHLVGWLVRSWGTSPGSTRTNRRRALPLVSQRLSYMASTSTHASGGSTRPQDGLG